MFKKMTLALLTVIGLSAFASEAHAYYPRYGGYRPGPYYGGARYYPAPARGYYGGYGSYYGYGPRYYSPYVYPAYPVYPAYGYGYYGPQVGITYYSPNVGVRIGF